ncbi:hypothetical protein LTR56_013545 [Elasticomyces elasticus]|nr:hypothetical protein LTR56_013545 [Elasticomyces elasticus]KAK3651009.1 hypothetical protein LTR22_012257 [Elasticomyces elasticus]KAK4931087.1 hypothetical protein LTR49_002503 [Elasticomyces elasticus]KAK5765555.1 hypothetical protein LTS12_004307 [Elasticomyces elasticus]
MLAFITLALAALAAAVPLEKGTTGEMVVIADIQDGGPPRNFTGTIQSVDAQILAINPSYVPRDVPDHALDLMAGKLHKRYTSVNCDIFSDIPARSDGIVTQLNTLHAKFNDQCCFPPGCARVACSLDNAVFACSRNGGQKCVPCGWLADSASAILGRCGMPNRNNRVWGNDAEPDFFVDVHTSDC